VFISGSAVGYYGDRGTEWLREDSTPGSGFLADVCKQWEACTEPARRQGIRVVCLRTGVVLARHGGALARMLLPFRLGVGGRVGSGRQYMSWITLDDFCAAVIHLMSGATVGPVNVVAPNPATNLDFTKALGRALSRPTVFPLPAAAARLVLGQMAEELLLFSARVEPAKLTASGFAFKYPNLDSALPHVIDES
jgi:uncharacterized protein (TIGR01777 family)